MNEDQLKTLSNLEQALAQAFENNTIDRLTKYVDPVTLDVFCSAIEHAVKDQQLGA